MKIIMPNYQLSYRSIVCYLTH